jgi:3',5'-cyclic AMP phosphodiesterase CpdA
MIQKKKIYQSFLLVCFVAVLLVGFSSALFQNQPVATASGADHITLTWAGDPRTTQTITWRTEVTTEAGQVQYAEASESKLLPNAAKIAIAEVEQLSTNVGSMSIHSATLTGLKPNTRYKYQVGDGSLWSESRTFLTAPSKVSGFKFLVFGDSQSINYNTWRTTVQQAYQANPDATFFTNVGDLVDVGQDYAQWNAWFDGSKGVIDTIPAMPLTGNHENYTPERKFSMPIFFTAQFKVPMNGPENLKRQVYSFDYGDVHFIMLDSQAGEEASFVPSMLEMQKTWLEKDLENTTKKWKVVFSHRPLYNNKSGGEGENVRRAFVPILDKYQVDVVFTGHDHVYARTYPLKNDGLVDKLTKGTVYVATGRSGSKTYNDTIHKEWNEFFYNPVDEPNYITVEVQGDVLGVKAYKQSGVLLDAWTIDKKTTGSK